MRLPNVESVREFGEGGPHLAPLGRAGPVRCFAYFFKSGQRLGPERREETLSLYVIRGRVRVTGEGHEEEGHSGDVFLIPAGEAYAVTNAGRDELVVFATVVTDHPA
ncbi:MAG: cupin domain-containing protein [Candidatus Methylomirabilales bacterium]